MLLRSIATVNVIYCFNGWGKEIKVQRDGKKGTKLVNLKTVKTRFHVLQQISALEARQLPAVRHEGGGGGVTSAVSLCLVLQYTKWVSLWRTTCCWPAAQEKDRHTRHKKKYAAIHSPAIVFLSSLALAQLQSSPVAVFCSGDKKGQLLDTQGKGVRRN